VPDRRGLTRLSRTANIGNPANTLVSLLQLRQLQNAARRKTANMNIFPNRFGLVALGAVAMLMGGCGAKVEPQPPSSTKLRDCVIYVPHGAPPSNTTAAQELQLHLREIVGSSLKIVHEPAQPMIALGDSPEARAAGIHAESIPYEGFSLKGAGGNIFIVGRDLPGDGPTPTDGKSLGTLYGAYEFLERVLGVRWLLPGDLGTYFPLKNPELEITGLNVDFVPKFKYRNFFVQAVGGIDSEAYCLRGRTQFYQMKIVVTDHGWPDLFPAPGSPEAAILKDRMTTFNEHPEWFQMARNGQRVAPTSDSFYLCLSNPELPEEIANRVAKFHQADPKRHIWCIGPTDGGPICDCPECQKRLYIMTPEEMGPTGRGNYTQSWTPLVLDYYRKTADIVKQNSPGLFVNALCYQQYEFPPREKPVAPVPDNFIAGMAPQHTAYGPVRLYEPVNQNWERWIKSWRGVFQKQVYYGLDFWIRQYAGAVMSPYPDIMKKTFSVLVEEGYDGAYFYSNPVGSNGPYCWVVTQMLWKPDGDPKALIKEFCDKAYGSGGESIAKILELSEANMRALITKVNGKVGHNMTPEMLRDVYAASWPEFEKLFQTAAAGAETPGEKWRLSLLANNFKVLSYHLTRLGMIKENPDSPFHLTPVEFGALVTSGYPGGPLRGLVDGPPEAREYTREWHPLEVSIPEQISNAEPRTEAWFAGNQEFVCLAEADGDAVLQLRYQTDVSKETGELSLPEVGYYHVFNGKGEKILTDIAENGRLIFPVKKGDTYVVAYVPLAGKGSNSRWSLLETKLVRYAVGYRNSPRGLYFTDTGKAATPYYFFVPETLNKFTIYLNGGQDVELFDPTGKSAGRKAGYGYAALEVDRIQSGAPSGWWKVKSLSNGNGFLQQGPGLSGYFVDDPSKALLVKLAN